MEGMVGKPRQFRSEERASFGSIRIPGACLFTERQEIPGLVPPGQTILMADLRDSLSVRASQVDRK